ncbi:MAG TPA: exo-alpha-sialidase [Planctomicrobium sp.]|nr:exo-alpha-sialidase [Planctomicrobium sp.]
MSGLRSMLLVTTFLVATDVAFAQTPAAPQKESDPIQKRCLEILKSAINSQEFWPSMHAAEALTLAGHDSLVRDALRPRLETVTDARQRCGVARELVRAGEREHARILFEVLASSDPYGHVHACESLFKVQETGDGVLLREAMQDQSSSVKALMAAAALAQAGNVTAMSFIRQELDQPTSRHSWVAAWILGMIGDQQDLPALRSGLIHQKTPQDRSHFEHALALLGDADGRKFLLSNLKQDDSVIRADAAYSAGSVTARKQLIALLDDDHLDVTVRAAQGLLTLEQSKPSATPRLMAVVTENKPSATGLLVPETTLTLAPAPGNSRNSEGDFIQTRDGRLLFIYSHFGQGTGGDHDVAELRERVSLDGGKTWLNEERTVVKPNSGLNVMSVSLLRLQSGEMALFYLAKVSLSDCRPQMRLSTDEGQTWGEPIRCITDEVDYYVLNNNRAIQLKSGRLVLPVCRHRALEANKRDWQGELISYLSDDKGQTWRRSKSTLTAKDDTGKRLFVQEPGVIELNDSRIVMFSRSDSGSQMLSYSSDGGDTWSNPQPSNIISPLSPASIARIPQTGDLLLVWNNHEAISPQLKGKRTPFTVAVSQDEGKTWRHVKDLETNPHGWYCYTAIEFVGETVLLGHCAGDRRTDNGLSITKVTRFGLDWLYDRQPQ